MLSAEHKQQYPFKVVAHALRPAEDSVGDSGFLCVHGLVYSLLGIELVANVISFLSQLLRAPCCSYLASVHKDHFIQHIFYGRLARAHAFNSSVGNAPRKVHFFYTT